jgi:hypothetical protein
MRALLFVSLAFGSATASAQQPADVSRQREAAQQLIDAQAEAAANAARPGDEDLSCEALQAEIVAIAQGSEMQAFAQGFGQQAAADLASVQEAQQAQQEEAARSRPRLFGQMVRGMATGVVPGADRGAAAAQQAAAMAQAAQAQAQAAQHIERMTAMSQQAGALAGPAMRGERVFELARARNCAWVEQGGAAPGAPGAVPAGAAPPAVPVPAR